MKFQVQSRNVIARARSARSNPRAGIALPAGRQASPSALTVSMPRTRNDEWRIGKITFIVALTLFSTWGLANPTSSAQESADYSIEVSQKFGRGLLNVLSSPLEIPCGIRDEVSERGGAGIGTGFFKGIAFFLRRVLVGVTEVGTFVIPMEATLPPVCAQKPAPHVESHVP